MQECYELAVQLGAAGTGRAIAVACNIVCHMHPAHLAMAALGRPIRCSSFSCKLLCSSSAGRLGKK